MTIAIHESALIRHFNTRKEVLRAWEERIGARFSPFRGFKMPDSRLYIEDSDFLDSIVDLIITNSDIKRAEEQLLLEEVERYCQKKQIHKIQRKKFVSR